jgi:ribonuclease P protein component
MISRSHRFHGYGSLRYVYQHGRTIRRPAMSLKYVPNRRRTSYRLAVVVSKKVNKSAVVRNRIRRRFYEAVRRHEADITEPYDIVLIVFSEQTANLPASELEEAVRDLLKHAKIT